MSQGTGSKHRAAKETEENYKNRGVLKVDAAICPEDIHYPTDSRFLNEARIFTEQLIDNLFEIGIYANKPRTYRKTAASYYLDYAKKKNAKSNIIRKCIRQQLQYIRRNLKHINKMLDVYEDRYGRGLPAISSKSSRSYLVVQHIYEQQNTMHRDGRKKIGDRIVSLHKPWVRPMVRGKAGKKVEFGSKVNVSETEGMIRMDRIDYNSYNEAKDLKKIVEGYKQMYGYYPQSVLVDKIYLNRENRKMLKDKEIEHYGSILGRPAKMSKQEKQKRKKKQNKRSEIEGKFGLGKLKYGMNNIYRDK